MNCNPEALRAGYYKWLRERRQALGVIAESAVTLPLDDFMKSEKDLDDRYADIEFDPVVTQDEIKIEGNPIDIARQYGVHAARLKNLFPGTESINLSSQVDFNTLARILQIEPVTLGHLMESKVLSPINLVKTHHHAYFDLNDIAKLLSINSIRIEDASQLIAINDLKQSQLPKYFGTSFSTIIEGIIHSDITLHSYEDQPSLMSCYADLNAVTSYLHHSLFAMESPMTVARMAKVLNTTPTHIFTLEKKGLILTNHWQSPLRPGDVELDLNSQKIFMGEVISLNRVCYYLKLRISTPSFRLL